MMIKMMYLRMMIMIMFLWILNEYVIEVTAHSIGTSSSLMVSLSLSNGHNSYVDKLLSMSGGKNRRQDNRINRNNNDDDYEDDDDDDDDDDDGYDENDYGEEEEDDAVDDEDNNDEGDDNNEDEEEEQVADLEDLEPIEIEEIKISRRATVSPTKSSLLSSSKSTRQAASSRRGKGHRIHRRAESMWSSIVEPTGHAMLTMIKNVDLPSKLSGITKTGQSVYQDVFRRAKIFGSSSLESMILQATWPSDDAIPGDIVTELIHHVVPTFKTTEKKKKASGRQSNAIASAMASDGLLSKLSMTAADINDPYRMLLHKIWSKACEADWRTIVKSITLLHILQRDTKEANSQAFATSVLAMSKYRNPKLKDLDAKYFDTSIVGRVTDPDNVVHLPFAKFYSQHVVFMFKNFGGKLKPIRSVTIGASSQNSTSEVEAVKVLNLAKKQIESILRLKYAPAEKRSVVVAQAIRLLALDLCDLWSQFSEKMQPILRRQSASSTTSESYKAPFASRNDIDAVVDFYNSAWKKINDFLSTHSKTFKTVGVKIPVSVAISKVKQGSSNALSAIESKNERLSNHSGTEKVATKKPTDIKGSPNGSNMPKLTKISGGFQQNIASYRVIERASLKAKAWWRRLFG